MDKLSISRPPQADTSHRIQSQSSSNKFHLRLTADDDLAPSLTSSEHDDSATTPSVYYDAQSSLSTPSSTPTMHIFGSKRSSRNSSLDRGSSNTTTTPTTNSNNDNADSVLPSAKDPNLAAMNIGTDNPAEVIARNSTSSNPGLGLSPGTALSGSSRFAAASSAVGKPESDGSDDSGYESTVKGRAPQTATTRTASPRPASRASARIPSLVPPQEHDESTDDEHAPRMGTIGGAAEEEGAGESMEPVPVIWSPANEATIKARRTRAADGGDGGLGPEGTGSAPGRSRSLRSTRSLPPSRSQRSLHGASRAHSLSRSYRNPADREGYDDAEDDGEQWGDAVSMSTYRRRRPSLSGGSFAAGAGTVGPSASALLDVEAFRARSREAEGALTPRQRSKIAKSAGKSRVVIPRCN